MELEDKVLCHIALATLSDKYDGGENCSRSVTQLLFLDLDLYKIEWTRRFSSPTSKSGERLCPRVHSNGHLRGSSDHA